MKICFIPIDNRPVCYSLAKDICAIDKSIQLFLPPREYLGDLKKTADVDKIFDWFKSLNNNFDIIILSLDTIAYGGLIPSRRSKEDKETILKRVEKFKNEWLKSNAKIYALSSIMRISNNNYNEEEKEYWKEYGEKIFRWSYETDKGNSGEYDIPDEILEDYISTRQRNFEINQTFLEWQKKGFFDELIFTKDDCAEFGLNIKEARILQENGAKVITGADEVPLSLLSKSIRKNISVKPVFIENNYKHLKSNYEDVSIEDSVMNQLRLAEIKVDYENPDIILIINNFKVRQGEIVMKVDTEQFSGKLELPDKPYMIADVRNANGADNNFVEQILPQINLKNFYGYSAWNTSANTIGTLLCIAKTRFMAEEYDEEAFKKIEAIRFLDDWAYQANVRQKIKQVAEKPNDIPNVNIETRKLMKPFEEKIKNIFITDKTNYSYNYTWERFFEIEVENESI